MRFVIAVIWLVILAVSVFPQRIEDGWKSLVPLKTTRQEAEKILGKPEIDDNGYYRYRTAEAFVEVNYSTSPCAGNQYNRGKYNVPADTILSYQVSLGKIVPIDEVKFDRKNYYRDSSSDLLTSITYWESIPNTRKVSSGYGVGIKVYLQIDKEYVTGFSYFPRNEEIQQAQCKNQP